MYDYKKQIEEFISQNFEVANPDECNFKMSSIDFLNFIFLTFPDGCISDYELNEIMLKLGFKRHTYTVEYVEIVKKVETKRYELTSGWCMNSISLKNTTQKDE